ncbi:ISL3 family transposase [Saccharopolyspora sp. ID03-671]|uniref:ISL3 family transposase n=1 Tax=Saccharopolyspora sp. ID03-671 TaxID=3073066 RepID=UPI0038731357
MVSTTVENWFFPLSVIIVGCDKPKFVILDEMAGNLLRALFPQLEQVRLERLTAEEGAVRFEAAACAPSAACPGCGISSDRVHSRYERRVADQCVSGREVVIRLRVRRFRCGNADCSQRIFVEQVAGLTERYQRRTPSLTRLLADVALALGGRAGARMTRRLAAEVSHMTLLRLLRALPLPETGDLVEVGVDDFALRRGHHYGTVLIDIRTHRPVDLLANRTAYTVAAWIARHPGVEVVCRDRAGAYADAAARGAPQAIQIADRWHLWHNLGQAVEKAVARHRAALQMPEPTSVPSSTAGPCAMPAVPPGPAPVAPVDRKDRIAHRTRTRHRQIHDLLDQGLTLRAITKQLGLSRGTVRRFARADRPDELLVNNGTGHRASLLEAYKPYLHQRWEAGCTNATRLCQEITARGYTGGFTVVRDYIRRLRTTPRHVPPPAPKPLTVRRATSWLMTAPENLDARRGKSFRTSLTAARNWPCWPSTSAGSRTWFATSPASACPTGSPPPSAPHQRAALLRRRPRARLRRRARRADPAPQFRGRRGPGEQDQNAQTPDVRPRQP